MGVAAFIRLMWSSFGGAQHVQETRHRVGDFDAWYGRRAGRQVQCIPRRVLQHIQAYVERLRSLRQAQWLRLYRRRRWVGCVDQRRGILHAERSEPALEEHPHLVLYASLWRRW